MVTRDRELTVSSCVAIVRARARLVAFVAAVCVVAAGYVVSAPRHYTASADLVVSPVASGDDDFVGVQVLHDSGIAPSSDVLTVTRLITSPATASLAARQPGVDEPAESLLARITASPVSQTSIVVITAMGSSPGQASAIANAFARATIARRTAVFQAALRPIVSRLQGEANTAAKSAAGSAAFLAIEGRLAALQPLLGAPDPTIDLLDTAQPLASPSSRHVPLTLLAALAGGLLLGVAVALLRELTDSRIRHEEQLSAPILGRVPADAGRAGAAATVAYRDLGARLFASPGSPRTIVFTAARDGDGASAAAVELARSLAAAGRRVVLLDADFSRPEVAQAFGVEAPDGTFDALFFGGDLRRGLVAAPGASGGLQLALPAPTGSRSRDVGQLEPEHIRAAVERLHEIADVVVVDTTPLARGYDGLLVVGALGATLVAVRLGATSKPALEQLGRMLDEREVAVPGLVVFRLPARWLIARAAVDRARAAFRHVWQPSRSGRKPRMAAESPVQPSAHRSR